MSNNLTESPFSGIGPLRGRKEYTPEERVILNHFWTNTDANVYAAKDTLPTELWALLMGQFARSSLTARERLLKLFEDMEKKGAPTKKEIAEAITQGKNTDALLERHLQKAGEFLELYGVRFGHASLRDSGTVRMIFEGVSQRATKELEYARTGAYQEVSTRAVGFTKESLGVPFEIRETAFETRFKDLGDHLMEFYTKLQEQVLRETRTRKKYLREEADQRLKREIGSQASISDREWESATAAKAFDVARYVLPQYALTSLGVTLNTRQFQDELTRWQSHPIAEIRAVGKAAQREAMITNPTLMKYGNPSEFQERVHQRIADIARELDLTDDGQKMQRITYEERIEPHSDLVDVPTNLEDIVLASILLSVTEDTSSRGNGTYQVLIDLVESLNNIERERIAQAVLQDKPAYEPFDQRLAVGSVTFERLLPIGDYRDLQRQRGDRQQRGKYGFTQGFVLPLEIEEVDLADEYLAALNQGLELSNDLKEEDMGAVAEYVPSMGMAIEHLSTEDPAQAFYVAGLRTQPAGAPAYRKIVQEETRQLLDEMPAFDGLVPWDENDYELGRLEETVEVKIREAKRAP